jgi:GntR family transcriptional regulator, transcriptional repressor for pyruvate dehydrogenase complex
MSSPGPLAIDAPNLTEQVVAALQTRVQGGEFVKGSKLPSEGELVATYHVSRTVVREAISQLRARGMVETRRGIGTFARDARPAETAFPVPRVDQATLAEVLALLELRISLETEAAALAAKRASEAQIARLRSLLAAIETAAQTGDDAADPDFEFHLTVAESTGNHFFSDLLRHLGRAIIPRTRIDSSAAAHQERGDYVRAVNREHDDIFRAIARSDSDAARAAMRTHLTNSRERLRQLRGESGDH